MTPSSLGEHSNLIFTIGESMNCAEVRTPVICQSLDLDLADIINSSLWVQETDHCQHDPDCELEAKYLKDVFTTSIVAPQAHRRMIAITQTKSNPVAQLLACGNDEWSLLQRDCCLNCAVEQANEQGIRQIIVA
jgi:hypothetical protein